MERFRSLVLVLLITINISLVYGDLVDSAKFMFFHGSTFDENEVYAFKNLSLISQHEKFNSEKPTVLYCHGYLEAPPNESIHLIVDSYLQRNDHNVVILDWSSLVTGDYILTAVPNAIAVARPIAKQLVQWFSEGLNVNKFHLVGHSLGGQLAGMIGKNVISTTDGASKLQRITGLDPANPPFFPALFMLALNKDDARFVDVIHTDGGLYGIPISSGTVDFWPNGGVTLQPGCPSRNYEPLTDNDLCSHRRSWRFWAESLTAPSGTAFPAVKANNFYNFKRNIVERSSIAMMGIECSTDLKGGHFYLQTNSQLPFSRGSIGTTFDSKLKRLETNSTDNNQPSTATTSSAT